MYSYSDFCKYKLNEKILSPADISADNYKQLIDVIKMVMSGEPIIIGADGEKEIKLKPKDYDKEKIKELIERIKKKEFDEKGKTQEEINDSIVRAFNDCFVADKRGKKKLTWGKICIKKQYDESQTSMLKYVQGYTTDINNYLRKGKKLPAEYKETMEKMDKGFTDTVKENTTVYRTVDWSFMKNLFNITKEDIDKHIGDEIVDKAYMSTAAECISPWGESWNNNELVLVIAAATDAPCFDVNKNIDADDIDCEEQKEVLFPRNTKLKIVSYEIKKNDKKDKKQRFASDGTYFIKCKMIK